MFDVAVIGAGPAGLSAALILGRCRRRVLLCDSGEPRNQASARVSGFLSRDGCRPADLRRIARDQLSEYPSVEIRDIAVDDVTGEDGRFVLSLSNRASATARKLILATGLADTPPPIEGAEDLFGRGVWTCPYCDGWELRDQTIGLYGNDEGHVGFAAELRQWTDDLVLFTDGEPRFDLAQQTHLDRLGVTVEARPIERLEAGPNGELAGVRLRDGTWTARKALFYMAHAGQRSALVEKLGCELGASGTARTSSYEKTNVPGVWVAGDASRRVQFAIVAAAEGALAAFAVNTELVQQDFGA